MLERLLLEMCKQAAPPQVTDEHARSAQLERIYHRLSRQASDRGSSAQE